MNHLWLSLFRLLQRVASYNWTLATRYEIPVTEGVSQSSRAMRVGKWEVYSPAGQRHFGMTLRVHLSWQRVDDETFWDSGARDSHFRRTPFAKGLVAVLALGTLLSPISLGFNCNSRPDHLRKPA